METYNDRSKKYSNKLKQCFYGLLGLNVSARNVPAVITSSLKLASAKANKLPSKSTVLNMNLERFSLSRQQIAEVFAQKEDTTLLTDETSKFGRKYMGYEAADKEGNLWVLGLREIESKSAGHTLKEF